MEKFNDVMLTDVDANRSPNMAYAFSSDSSSSESGSRWEISRNDPDGVAKYIVISDTEPDSEEVIGYSQYSETLDGYSSIENKARFSDTVADKRGESILSIKCGWRHCKEMFENEDARGYHQVNYHRIGIKKTYECYLCKRSLSANAYIRKHMRAVHTRRKRYLCSFPMCTRAFYSFNSIVQHTKRLHFGQEAFAANFGGTVRSVAVDEPNGDNRSVMCTKYHCSQLFKDWSELLYHVSTFHGCGSKVTFECHLCRQTSGSKYKLMRHMNCVHVGVKPFQCPIQACAKRFARKDNMQSHFSNTHRIRPNTVNCNVCTKSFNTRKSLKRHKKYMHRRLPRFGSRLPSCSGKYVSQPILDEHEHPIGSRTFDCYLCGRTCPTQCSLRSHMNHVHTVRKRLKCPILECSAKFSKQAYLKTHLAYKHGEGTEHRCDICNKHLASRHSLRLHMSVHGADKRFKCPIGMCSAGYNQRNRLEVHIANMHAEIQTFPCPVCREPMGDQKSLEMHVRGMHRLTCTKFECPDENCSEKFNNKLLLDNHIRFKHPLSRVRVVCPMCEKPLSSKYYLVRHLNRVHNVSYPDVSSTSKEIKRTVSVAL